jgi:hypothetical protein
MLHKQFCLLSDIEKLVSFVFNVTNTRARTRTHTHAHTQTLPVKQINT